MSWNSVKRPVVLAIVLFAAMPGAGAQDATGLAPELQALFPQGEEACYLASIDAGAMKPGQKLTEMHLYRLFDPDPLTEAVKFSRDEMAAFDRTGMMGSWADIAARFSDAPQLYSQTVSCSFYEDSKVVRCGVECDGGSFTVMPSASGIDAIFGEESGGLSLNQSCGEPNDETGGRWMTPEEAGGTVALERTDLVSCRQVASVMKPEFVGNLPPIRQRIDRDGWRCMKRTYDAAHLAKNPQQKVKSMALSILGRVKVTRDADSFPETQVNAVLSFRMLNGNFRERAVTCTASDYEFNCEGGFRLRRTAGNSLMVLAGEGWEDADTRPLVLDVPMGAGDRVFRLDRTQTSRCSAS